MLGLKDKIEYNINGDFMFKLSIQEKIDALGFKTFTPIQEAVFKAYPKELHIIGLAPTGTGKTHAYLLPILNDMDIKYEAVQAVICVPTNELVMQVETMLKGINPGFSVKAYTSSKDRSRELEALTKKQPQIVISTPGRLEDYAIQEGKLKIHTAKVFVLDEADMMLDMDFMTTLDRVFYAVRDAKMLMFSATLPDGLTKFLDKYFGKAYMIDLKDPSVLKITHGLVYTRFDTRDQDLKRLVKTINPYLCMVFVSKKEQVDHVYQQLQDVGIKAIRISGDTPSRERKTILDDIKQLKYTYIVSSDLGSRGLDIIGVSHIIHYELPYHLEYYIHRSGRTGRANQTGMSIALVTTENSRKIENLVKKGIHFQRFQLDGTSLVPVIKKSKGSLSEDEMAAIRKVKKPTKVSPNYKKKNKKLVKKARNTVRFGGK